MEAPSHVEIRYEDLYQTDKFTYLVSIITPEDGTKEDTAVRPGAYLET